MFAEGDSGYLMTPSNVDTNGAYLIDRSPTYFEPILNYLRNGQLIIDSTVNPEGLHSNIYIFFSVEDLNIYMFVLIYRGFKYIHICFNLQRIRSH